MSLFRWARIGERGVGVVPEDGFNSPSSTTINNSSSCRVVTVNGALVLPVIFGIITTVLFYEGYGTNNHIEQLPIVLRSLDSSYLQNDFFTNASATSVARLWYSRSLAMLAGGERNLPVLFFVITLVSNIVISVITCKVTRHIFDLSLAGIWASALAMSINTFRLGYLARIYQTTLVPATITIPCVLGSVYLLMKGKIVMAILLSGISSLFHPLLGLETGGLLFAVYIISRLLKKQKLDKSIVFALLLFLPFAILLLLPHILQHGINSNQFIYIVAHFRHPHHYIPSSFSFSEYIDAVAFLIVLALIYYKWFRTNRSPFRLIPAIIVSVILILCVGGYVFVELIPYRIWTTAQTFRLLYVIKWLGVIFVAGTIANLQRSTQAICLSSVFSPVSLGVAFISQPLRINLNKKGCHRIARILAPAPIMLIIVFLIMTSDISPKSVLCLSFYVFAMLTFSVLSSRLYLVFATCIIFAVGILFFLSSHLPYIQQVSSLNQIRQNLSFAIKPQLGIDGNAVAEFAKNNTSEQSLFLTPPLFGQFRLLANRAIVVDFKAFPFSDEGVKEWYDRIVACYGSSTSTGFEMVSELDRNYHSVDDKTLVSLQERYGFDYAVLYSNTSTSFDVIFQNDNYKMVSLLR